METMELFLDSDHDAPRQRDFYVSLGEHPDEYSFRPDLKWDRGPPAPGECPYTMDVESESPENLGLYTLPTTQPSPPPLVLAKNNTSASTDSSTAPTLASALMLLQNEADADRKERMANAEQSGSKVNNYGRHQRRYFAFWTEDQARRAAEAEAAGMAYFPVPARPMTAAKACVFLKHEVTRNTLGPNGQPIPNTFLAPPSVDQIISALEQLRYDETGTKVNKLRDDANIRSIIQASHLNEANRQDKAQKAKANGLLSQTITRDQLQEVALGLLAPDPGKPGGLKAAVLRNRDRGMLLTAVSTAMRGDNVRSVLWSDLTLKQCVLINIGEDYKTTAFVITSNQGKTNRDGKIDLHAALRHRHPELCAIGAAAMQLFFYFHVQGGKDPGFAPVYDDPRATDIGFRPWYEWVLFPSQDGPTVQLSLAGHMKRVNSFKLAYDIFAQKVTHLGRTTAVRDGKDYGATVEGVMALGLWSQGGAFKVYDRSLPIDAMLACAYFNGEKKDSYFIARDFLEPPSELVQLLFPFVEGEEAAYQARLAKLGNAAKDESLVNFLNVLRFFRRVLLQDVAVLAHQNPELKMTILEYAPFNTAAFHAFKERTGSILEQVEAEFQERRNNLPEMLVQSFNGHMQAVRTHQIAQQRQLQDFEDKMDARFSMITQICASSAPLSKKRKMMDELEAGWTQPHRPAPSTFIEGGIPGRGSVHPSKNVALISATPLAPSAPDPTSSPPDSTSLTQTQFVSGAGNIFSTETFPLSQAADVQALQMKYITKLEAQFPVEKLKHSEFEWVLKKKEWMFLPMFEWWAPAKDVAPTISDIWREWNTGIGHRFSILELVQGWQALWKRDKNSIKSQWTRRYKLVTLIQDLAKQNGWSPDDALEFLEVHYPLSSESTNSHFRSSRSFADWLKGDEERKHVLANSTAFTPSSIMVQT